MTAVTQQPLDNLTPQGRAALVTYLLMKRRSMTTRQLVEVTGITGAAVRSMMDNLTSPRLDRWKKESQCAAEEIRSLKYVQYASKEAQAAEFKECRKALIRAQARHRTEHDRLQTWMENIIRKHSPKIDLAVLGSWLVRYPDSNISRRASSLTTLARRL